MVNMNAVDDKKSVKSPSNINGINSEPITACSSDSGDQVKLNVSQPQNGDCNKHPITNGAYSKVSLISCSVAASVCENGEPSTSRTISNTQVVSRRPDSESTCGESEQGLSRNSGSDAITSKQAKPVRDRGICDYDRGSSSEDEECCIYTYKGDSSQMADLPSSFFRLDVMPSRPNGNSRNSSPDMDYLEMDFDPGPSNDDRYSSSDSECEDDRNCDERFVSDIFPLPKPPPDCEASSDPVLEPDFTSAATPVSPLSTPSPILCPKPQPTGADQPSTSGTVCSSPPSPPRQPSDAAHELSQASYCYCITNKQAPVSIDENFNEGDAGTMIWKEHEAREKHVSQIATSACGATAVINALVALNVQFTVNAVKQHVATRYRNETAPIAEYLMSRCDAGATHVDMIRGLQGASQDTVYARFFHMFPQRSISLTSWLSHWIRKGAVPIATLNLQRGVQVGAEMPDFWHHQTIYGVGARGVYLTNPLEVRTEAQLWPQLASPSVMLVRRHDVLSRWTPDTSLHPLIDPSRPLWRKMNVLGQVVNVIREGRSLSHTTSYVSIPASYSSGITLAVLKSSPAYDELRFAPELPVDPLYSDTSLCISNRK